MRSNRGLVLIALLLILVAVIGGYLWLTSRGNQGTLETEVVPTEPPQKLVDIVVAAQNINRGQRITVEDLAVILQSWPEDALPLEYFDSLEQVDQKFARMDIPRGMPIVPRMLGEPGGMLSVEGSAAALFESGRVAYAIPIDTQGAVAWAPMPGDHVDVIAAIKLITVDEEFQSPLPNQFISLPGPEEAPLSGAFGRFETLPNGQEALVFQSGATIPHLVVQLTVQDAIVWRIGIWTDPTGAAVTGATAPAQTAQPGGLLGAAPQQQQQPTPVPTPMMRGDVEPVTLLVRPQDALVLKYLLEMGADLDLVLRPAGDTSLVITEPVWLRYILDKYQIPDQPADLPVAATPVRPPLELTPIVPPVEN